MRFQVFVNKDKGTVVVKAEDPMSEYRKEFCDFYERNNATCDFKLLYEFCVKYRRQIEKMVGISTCNYSAGDVFDRELGEKIARERYLKVFETYRIKMYEMIYRKFDAMRKLTFNRYDYCIRRRLDRELKIDKLVWKKV